MGIDFTKVCFIICPIGEENSESRKNSDAVLKHIIFPALEQFDLKPVRADQIDDLGIITSQIVHYIMESNLLIADLTESNPNVFYELAIRHMIKKPVIKLRKIGEQVPFDISASRIIDYELSLDKVNDAKDNIVKAIIAIQNNNLEYGNPISLAVETIQLKASSDPEKKSIAEMLDMMSELRYGVTKIEKRLSKIDYEAAKDYVENYLIDIKREILNEIHDIIKQMDVSVNRRGLSENAINTLQKRLSKLEGKFEGYLESLK